MLEDRDGWVGGWVGGWLTYCDDGAIGAGAGLGFLRGAGFEGHELAVCVAGLWVGWVGGWVDEFYHHITRYHTYVGRWVGGVYTL